MSHGKRVFFPRGEESKTVFSEIKLKGRHDEADTAVLSSIIQIQLHEMINCLKKRKKAKMARLTKTSMRRQFITLRRMLRELVAVMKKKRKVFNHDDKKEEREDAMEKSEFNRIS